MNKARLLKLAHLLEKDATKKDGICFDYSKWGIVSDQSSPLSCGTQACAMGLAALSGAFKDAGLDFEIKKTGSLVIKHSGSKSPILAAMRTFELKRWEAETLFASSWTLPKTCGAEAEVHVARRIRDFVAAA